MGDPTLHIQAQTYVVTNMEPLVALAGCQFVIWRKLHYE